MDTLLSSTARRLRSIWPLLPLAAIFLSADWTALHAQDTATDNPTGPSGDYNGEVTTAGSYDPFTLNAKRSVTDLVVLESSGTYPLAFTRIYNSHMYLAAGEPRVLGDGGNWRHSYMWTLSVAEKSGQQVTAYNLAYPDGGYVTFRPGRSNAPSGEYATYWRGPAGIQDRLEVPSGGTVCLHRNDGGLVYFGSGSYPSSIVDPYGATTTLAYNSGGFLSQVTEPGGRWLQFNYKTVKDTVYGTQDGQVVSATWVLLDNVQASTGQSVTYGYQETEGTLQSGYPVPYQVLTSATYNAEPSVSGSGYVQASYSYEFNGGGTPVITTASDPHYTGAMTSIRYHYTSTGSGLIQEEQNSGSSQRVSNVSRSISGTVTTATETRGDTASGGASITRTFKYGETTINGVASNAEASQLTTSTDFQGNPTYLSYYGAGNSNGQGNLFSVTNALGYSTLYGHEPYAGKVYAMQLPDGRVRNWNWLAKDLSTQLQPYYLYQYTDERGQKTTYQRYPNTGLLNEIDYPDGGKETFTYTGFSYNNNAFYKVHVHTDTRGAQTIYNYDETDVNHGGSGQGHVGLLTSTTRSYKDSGNTIHQERTVLYYDALDRLSQVTDPGGVATQYTYNARHQLLRTTHAADGTHTDNAYDDYGNRTSVSDELGHTATTTYDGYRRVIQVTVPVNDGSYASRSTYFVYDPRDRSGSSLATATSHTRSTWSVTWVSSSKAVEHVYSPNNWLTWEYKGITVSNGGANNSVNISAASGYVATQVTSFSAVGQPLTVLDDNGQPTTYTYDNCGRKTSVTDPLGHTTSWTYYGPNQPSNSTNYAGWLQSVTTPGPDLNSYPTVTTQYTAYDPMGRVTSTTDPSNHTFFSDYNSAGDLTAQTDGDASSASTQTAPHNTIYAYDQLGRKASITNPRTGGSETWTYNASGNVATYKTYGGATCAYIYDGRNRCTGDSWNDSVTSPTGYQYDAASRVTAVTNWHATINYTYDDSGAALTESMQPGDLGSALTTTYTHDIDGNVASIVYPSGHTPVFAYDCQQRCTGMSSGSTVLSQYNYTGDWLTGRWLNNGLYTEYDYQANGRVWDVWHYHASDRNGTRVSNGSVSRHIYGFEPDGQISWFERWADSGQSGSTLENGNGDCYFYAPDGSVSGAYRNYSYNGGNWPYQGNSQGDSRVDSSALGNVNYTADTYGTGYVYDPAGNRSTVTNYDYTKQAVGSGSAAATADNGYTVSTYDANFNTTTTTSGAGWTYSYDGENHLSSATGPGGASASFNYDGLGRLTKQIVNGTTTRFYYAGGRRIEEHDASNNYVYAYFFDAPGSDRLLFRYDASANFLWYQSDLLGNTTHVSNGAGTVVEQYLYDAYGKPSVYTKSGGALAGSGYDNRYLFKSSGAYEWMPSMATYYCRARFYLPQQGRFLQPDPIGQAGGLNIYKYCSNDPVNLADPSGCDTITVSAPLQSYAGSGGGYFTGSYPPTTAEDGNTYIGVPIDGSSGSTTGSGPGGAGNALTPQQMGVSTFSGSGMGNSAAVAGGGGDGGGEGSPGIFTFRLPPGMKFKSSSSYDWRTDYRTGPMTDADRVFQLLAADGTLEGMQTFDEHVAWFATVGMIDFGLFDGAGIMAELEGFFGGKCFPEETLIDTPAGKKQIQDIHTGDTVYAFDLETNKVTEERVTAVHKNYTYHWARIDVDGEEIRATRSHPFWVEDAHRWYKASDLKPGMKLRLRSNIVATVRTVSAEDFEVPQSTYNFEVACEHDYFVGKCAVLVHNGDGNYTITFASGKTYDGKGDIGRANTSAQRISRLYNDPVVGIDWTPANGTADSFVGEEMRMRNNGAPGGNTYNQINQPGKKIAEDSGCP